MVVGVIGQYSRVAVNLGSGFVHVAVGEHAVLAGLRSRRLLSHLFRRNFALVYFYISVWADSLIRNWQRDDELNP